MKNGLLLAIGRGDFPQKGYLRAGQITGLKCTNAHNANNKTIIF